MEGSWIEPLYNFVLNHLILNGVEYASGQTLTVNSPGNLITGPGVFGGTFIQNISDWLNTIPGVNNAGFIFHDDMSTIDTPNISSTYAVNIGRRNTLSGPYYQYWWVNTLFSPYNSSTQPVVGYGTYGTCINI
jgi:hypothetical protein